MTADRMVTTADGGGFVVTCECQWLRWWPTEKDAAEGAVEHAKKCKAGDVAA